MATRVIKKSWWIDFRFNYIRYRKRSPENSRAGALAYEAFIRSQLAKGIDPFKEKEQKEQCKTFEQFAWEWYDTYVISNNKFSEARNKKIILINHLIPHFSKTPITEINNLQVEMFKSKMKEANLSNKSINNYLGVLSKCLNTADDWYGLAKLPKIKRLRVAPQKFDFLTHEESEVLLNHADGIWREIILVILKTGIRIGELLALDWSDIDWRSCKITIRRAVYNGIIDSPKNNRIRHIPMAQEVRTALGKRMKKWGYVYSDENGQLMNDKTARHFLQKICRRAKMRKIGWHVLRHSFASHLVMAGAPLKAIQDLLGHSSLSVTMRYSHLTPSTLEDAVRLLEAREKVWATNGQPSQ